MGMEVEVDSVALQAVVDGQRPKSSAWDRCTSFLLTMFLLSYYALLLVAGTTHGAGSLKDYTHCCANLHVALGAAVWFVPPLALVFVGYQIGDHLKGEPLHYSLVDMGEYFVGFAMAHIAHRVKPLRRPKDALRLIRELLCPR